MNAVFYYFTGTGNTERVLNKLKTEWESLGHSAELKRILPDTAPEPAEYDRVVVGFPVHAFNAPTPVYAFLKKFPKLEKGQSKNVFLLRVSGEPLKLNEASGVVPGRILRRRGYRVAGEFWHVMPYNIIFRHTDGMAARMEAASNLKIPENARDLEANVGVRPHINVFKRFTSFLFRIEHPAMPVIGVTFRADKKKCVGCGKCAAVCPRGNITMKDGKPKFGGHCVGCMGCAFLCPKDAIRTSLLNSWRVNGAYTFKGDPCKDEEIGRYCRKAYLRYFHEAEAVLAVEDGETGEEEQLKNTNP